MRNLFIVVLWALPIMLLSQKLTEKQKEDFKYIKDDFYPQNNHYALKNEKKIGYEFFKMSTNSLLPRIYEDGSIKLVMNFESTDWGFINSIVIKADTLYEIPAISDCIRETLTYSQYGPSIREICFFEIDPEHFEKIAKHPYEVKIRLYGKDSYYEIKHHNKEWQKCLILYWSLKKK